MAIEALQEGRIAEKKFAISPIEQFTAQKTFELINMYWNNRNFTGLDSSLNSPRNVVHLSPEPGMSMVKGVLEIQSIILKMLGQEILIGGKPPRELYFQNTASGGYLMADRKVSYIGKINEEQVQELLEKYEEQRKAFAARDLNNRDEKSFDDEDFAIRGRMSQLDSTLEALGQGKVLQDITSKANTIDWIKNRSTGYGELQ